MLHIPAALAATSPEDVDYGMELDWQRFKWKEFDDDGSRLLVEDGARFGLGGWVGNLRHQSAGTVYQIQGKVYLAEVDYDGQTQTSIPAETDTRYFGAMVEALGGQRLALNNDQIVAAYDFFGALGVDSWLRDLRNGRDINGNRVSGGEEYYTVIYSKLGMAPVLRGDRWAGRLSLGIKYPLWVYELIPDDFSEVISLAPKPRVSGFAALSQDFVWDSRRILKLELYYDSYRFAKSDSERVSPTLRILQPKSEMDVYGLRLGLSF